MLHPDKEKTWLTQSVEIVFGSSSRNCVKEKSCFVFRCTQTLFGSSWKIFDPILLTHWRSSNRSSLLVFSGLRFHNECGVLVLTSSDKDELLKRYCSNAERFGKKICILTNKDLKTRYPYLAVPSKAIGILLPHQGGHINPRIFVQAQQQIARNHGCHHLTDIVDSLHEDDSGRTVLNTARGKQIVANKVLLATGAFTECRRLLPQGLRLAMRPTTETVLFVRNVCCFPKHSKMHGFFLCACARFTQSSMCC